MFIFEILIIVVVFAFVANGYRVGSIETLGRLLGSVFGFLAAKNFSYWLIGLMGIFMPVNWAYLTSFVLIFLAVDSAIGFLFKIGEKIFKIITKLPILKQIDGLLGGVFGFFEAVIVIGGVSWLLRQGAFAESGISFFTNLKSAALINTIFESLLQFLL
ncbi:MAG TPA: CvpA family protein [Candidatus Methylomirabilis sp.]|nr:CvpA family protein [Candidatus Methylomirabilis sp.]